MKEQAKNTAKQPIQKNELEALKAENKKLREQLEATPQSLEEKIQYFQQKKEQIKKLETLDSYAETLINVSNEIEEKSKEEGFLSETFSFKVTKKQSYRDEVEVLKVQHPKVIGEVLGFALDKINDKREDLRKLINA